MNFIGLHYATNALKMEAKVEELLGEFKYFYIRPNARVAAVTWKGATEPKTVTKVYYYTREEMVEFLSKAVMLGGEIFIIIPINGNDAWAGFSVNANDIIATNSMLYNDPETGATQTMEHAK